MDKTSATRPGGSVLLVDDTPTNLYVLTELLEREGLTVTVAHDSEEALLCASEVEPDLILLDVPMLSADGFEICRQLKQLDKACEIPVIFITDLSSVDDKLKAFACGGADYINKPIEPAEALVRVKTHLALRAAGRLLQSKNQRLLELVLLHQESEFSDGHICQDLVDLLPQAILVHTESEIVWANAAAVKLFGVRSARDLIGTSLLSHVPEAFHDFVQQWLQAATAPVQGEANFHLLLWSGEEDGQEVEIDSVPLPYSNTRAVVMILREMREP